MKPKLLLAALAFFLLWTKPLHLTLISNEIEEMPSGTEVIFGENFHIGKIGKTDLFPDHVEYRISILKKHRDVINQSSKFYLQKRRENGEIKKYIKVGTPKKTAQRLENEARLQIQSKSFWDLFK